MSKEKKNIKKRVRMSDEQLMIAIKKELNKGNAGKTNLYEQMRTKITLGKQRFLNVYDKAHFEWAELKQKAQSDGTYQATKEAAKNGLKSKIEKQLHLQQMIDRLQDDIDKEIVQDYVFIKGQLQLVNKVMSPQEKAYLIRTIKDLYTELNKMDGDYAPAKVENSGAVTIKWAERKSYDEPDSKAD